MQRRALPRRASEAQRAASRSRGSAARAARYHRTRARLALVPDAGVPEVQSVQGGSQFNERILFAHRKLRKIAEALLNFRCRLSLRIIPCRACHVVLLAQLI